MYMYIYRHIYYTYYMYMYINIYTYLLIHILCSKTQCFVIDIPFIISICISRCKMISLQTLQAAASQLDTICHPYRALLNV